MTGYGRRAGARKVVRPAESLTIPVMQRRGGLYSPIRRDLEERAGIFPPRGSVDEAAQADADGEADGDERGEDGGDAGAHQRQRHADDRQDAERHADVDEYLKREAADNRHDDEHP